MRNPVKLVLALAPLALVAAAAPTAAQIRVDQQRPAEPAGRVCVENLFGSIEIVGWDRNEVAVRGTLAAGVEDFDVDADEEGIDVDVDVPDAWLYASDDDTDYRSTLTVQVPRGSSVCAESLNASVSVRDVGGAIEVETVNGRVAIAGDPRSVEVETMTGDVEVRARSAAVAIESLSGAVDVEGARGRVEIETVSGPVRVVGGEIVELGVETTSGDVALDVDPAARGEIDVSTHSGAVTLTLPRAVRARFELVTFSGTIESDLGPAPSRRGAFLPETRLRFSTGTEDFEVSVETFEAPIALRARGERP